MKLVIYNEYLISIADTDGLVILRQGISSYIPMYSKLFMGKVILCLRWHMLKT